MWNALSEHSRRLQLQPQHKKRKTAGSPKASRRLDEPIAPELHDLVSAPSPVGKSDALGEDRHTTDHGARFPQCPADTQRNRR